MDGQENGFSDGAGSSSGGADEVSGNNSDANQEPAGNEPGAESGGGDGGGDGEYLTITYYDSTTNEPVYYSKVPISELSEILAPETETEDSEAVQVYQDVQGDVPDFQMMLGTWCIVVVVVLFGIFGALCVGTLVRSLEMRKS